MNLLATAASVIGAALVGRPLSSDALKLGIGAAKSSTVDSYFGLERLLALVSLLTTVGLTLVADTQFPAFGLQVPYSPTAYPSVYIFKATRSTRLAATPSTTNAFVDSTNVGLWIAGMVLAFVGGSGTALIRCGGQAGQDRSSTRPSGSARQEEDDPGGRRHPSRGGPPQPPADPSGGRGLGSNNSRPIKPNSVSHGAKNREDPPPPPPPPTTTACGDGADDKPEIEHLLFGILVGLCISVLFKVINKYIKKRKAPKPDRGRNQPARINVSRTAARARALAICVLPAVPLTLLAGCACAWNQGPPHSYAPSNHGPIKAGVILSAITLATLVLYLFFVMARMVFGGVSRFYSKMTGDYDDFDEDVGDHDQTWSDDDSGNDGDDDIDDDIDDDNGGDDSMDDSDDDGPGGDNDNDCNALGNISNFLGRQYDIEDVDHIDDDDLGSDFFGEQYDVDDLLFDPGCSRQRFGFDLGQDIHQDEGEADSIYSSFEIQNGDQEEEEQDDEDEDDLTGMSQYLPPVLESSIEEDLSVSASQHMPVDVPDTPPRRPVSRGEPASPPSADERASASIQRRSSAGMAGVSPSPSPGGLGLDLGNSPSSSLSMSMSISLPSLSNMDISLPSLSSVDICLYKISKPRNA